MTRVELRQIAKTFGGHQVLAGLDLCIESGSYVVLLGPSGCGKTTTLRIIAGLNRPDRGEVCLGGKRVDGIPPRERNVAMVFQHDSLYPHLTVGQSLRFALKGSIAPAELESRVAEAVALTGIESILDRYPSRLSGGELRRAAVAKAIARRTAVRLLDEPLSALDISVRQALQDDILRWHATVPGTSIHVTHDGQEAMRMADRIAVMDRGRIVQFATPDEVFRRPATVAVAKAVGSPTVHFFAAQVNGGELECENPRVRLQLASGAKEADRDVLVGVRPDSFRVINAEQQSSSEWESDGLVVEAELLRWQPVERHIHLHLQAGSENILAVLSDDSLGLASITPATLRTGQTMRLAARREETHLFDAHSGERIDPVTGG
jgi:multiple sugar transport system ATP-binding protein